VALLTVESGQKRKMSRLLFKQQAKFNLVFIRSLSSFHPTVSHWQARLSAKHKEVNHANRHKFKKRQLCVLMQREIEILNHQMGDQELMRDPGG
jgi:hypothetical protein